MTERNRFSSAYEQALATAQQPQVPVAGLTPETPEDTTAAAEVNQPQPTEGPEFFDFVDTVGAVAAGAEDAVHDFYGLLDTMTADLMPDWDEQRFFEQADTTVGKIVQGLSHFATGFIATGGALSVASKVATAGRFLGAANVLRTVGAGGTIATAAAKGAITDFAFYRGSEARLSDALLDTPLAPIAAALASNPDDSELVGRFKNTIEGMGLGVAADTILAGMKGLFRARKVVNEAAQAGTKPTDALIKDALNVGTVRDTARKTAVEVGAIYGPPNPVHGRMDQLQTIGLTDLDATKQYAQSFLDPHFPEGAKKAGRNLTPEEQVRFDQNKDSMSILSFEGEDSMFATLRTFGAVARDMLEVDGKKTVTNQQTLEAAHRIISNTTVLDDEGIQGWVQRGTRDLGDDAKNVRQASENMVAQSIVLNMAADDWFKRINAPADLANLTDTDLHELILMTENASMLMEGISGVRTEFGRGLQSTQIKIRGDQSLLAQDATSRATRSRAAEDSIFNSGGKSTRERSRQSVINQLERVKLAMNAAGDDRDAFTNAFFKGVTPLGKNRRWSMVSEYWYGSVLSGPKTHLVNFIGNTAAMIHRPVELAVGGTFQMAFGGGSKGVRLAWDETRGLMQGFLDLAKMGNGKIGPVVAKAFANGESTLLRDANHEITRVLQGRAITKDTVAQSVLGRMAGSFMGEWGKEAVSAAGGAIGAAARIPGRALQASDELFKQLNFRSAAFGDLSARGRALGLEGDGLNNFVAEKMNRLITDGQAMSHTLLYNEAWKRSGRTLGAQARDPKLRAKEVRRLMSEIEAENADLLEVSQAAGGVAAERTFTENLDSASKIHQAGRLIENAARSFPSLRMFVPFIKTPTNLLKFGHERLPLEPMMGIAHMVVNTARGTGKEQLAEFGNRTARILAHGSDAEKTETMGRIATAIGGVAGLSYFAAAGLQEDSENGVALYGRGPSNPKEAAVWKEAGRIPYSIRIGDKFFSYERLDPFSTILGTVADAMQYAHFAGDEEAEEIQYAILAAVTNNFTRKSYLTGLSNLMTVMTTGDANRVERVLQQMSSAFVPAAVGQTTQGAFDGEMKEVRSILEASMAKVPYFSGKIEARRDVFGRKLKRIGWESDKAFRSRWSPFPVTDKETSDPVNQELARLRHGWTAIQRNMTINRVKLDLLDFTTEEGQTALDRYRELSGEVTIGGQSMYERVQGLIRSKAYQRLPDNPDDDSIQNPRVLAISRIVSGYRRVAKRRLLTEFPEIGEEVQGTRAEQLLFRQ